MHPRLIFFLTSLKPAVTGACDECLHCTLAGHGNLAAAAGLTAETFPRIHHEELLEALHATATTPALQQAAARTTGLYLFWLFNHVYLVSPTSKPDFHHALRRMACRVEWGELWKIRHCGEPPMRSYPEALAFLRQRLPTHPEWQASALHSLLMEGDGTK